MSIDNANNFVKESNIHVANINRLLKNIKLDIMADFIHIENTGMVISTNKVANPLDLQTIKKYIKNTCCIEVEQIEPLRLPQSKSYLKIIGIPNLSEQTNTHITSDEIDKILKNTHIFNDIVLASKPRVIKVSPQVQHGYCLDWHLECSKRYKSKEPYQQEVQYQKFYYHNLWCQYEPWSTSV